MQNFNKLRHTVYSLYAFHISTLGGMGVGIIQNTENVNFMKFWWWYNSTTDRSVRRVESDAERCGTGKWPKKNRHNVSLVAQPPRGNCKMQNDDYPLYLHSANWEVHSQKYSYKKTQGGIINNYFICEMSWSSMKKRNLETNSCHVFRSQSKSR